MSDLDIKAHARAHVKELTARTTELVGEVIAKGMLGVLEEAISMKVRIDDLEAALAQRPASAADSGRDAALVAQGRAQAIEECAQAFKSGDVAGFNALMKEALAHPAASVAQGEGQQAAARSHEVIVSSDQFGPILEIPGFIYTVHREITPDQIERLSRNAANVVLHRVSQALRANLDKKGGAA